MDETKKKALVIALVVVGVAAAVYSGTKYMKAEQPVVTHQIGDVNAVPGKKAMIDAHNKEQADKGERNPGE